MDNENIRENIGENFINPNTNLPNKWNLWYHREKDNWKISGYRNIYEITTVADFWKLHNNWTQLKGINSKHYFLMKDDIEPIWEHPINKNGGCWSFKVGEELSEMLWTELAVYLVCDKILTIPDNAVGLSICLRKNSSTIIKIWNRDSKYNSLNLINKKILNKWGTDCKYIANMPDI